MEHDPAQLRSESVQPLLGSDSHVEYYDAKLDWVTERFGLRKAAQSIYPYAQKALKGMDWLGGKFAHGALSAGITEMSSGGIGDLEHGWQRITAAAIVRKCGAAIGAHVHIFKLWLRRAKQAHALELVVATRRRRRRRRCRVARRAEHANAALAR